MPAWLWSPRRRLALGIGRLSERSLRARNILDPAEALQLRPGPRLGLDAVILHAELLNAAGGTHACVSPALNAQLQQELQGAAGNWANTGGPLNRPAAAFRPTDQEDHR